MCYAGGPYCDTKYGKDMVEAGNKFTEAKAENRVLQDVVEAKISQQDFNMREVPSQYRALAERADKTDAQGAQNMLDASKERVGEASLEVRRTMGTFNAESPSGVECLQAAQLSNTIRQGTTTSEWGTSIAANEATRKKILSHHNNAMRKVLEENISKEASKDPRNMAKFQHSGTSDKFSMSHPKINDGEPYFTEKAKTPYTSEEIQKLGQKASSERVIYKTRGSYAPGYLVSDGVGSSYIIPDTINADQVPREVTEKNTHNVRPTDAPGTSHVPYSNRSQYWDNASKSRTRSKVAPVWESFKNENDTPAEREMRGKVFHSAYTVADAQKNLGDVRAAEHQTLAEVSRDVEVGAASQADYDTQDKRSQSRIKNAAASETSARMAFKQMSELWGKTHEGRTQDGADLLNKLKGSRS